MGPLLIAAIVGVLLAVPRGSSWAPAIRAASWSAQSSLRRLWFVVFYPNISALPLPGLIVNSFQGLIPTWIYDFQFAANTDAPANTPLLSRDALLLTAMIGVATVAVMYATWTWRLELAARRARRVAAATAGASSELRDPEGQARAAGAPAAGRDPDCEACAAGGISPWKPAGSRPARRAAERRSRSTPPPGR